MRLVRMLVLSGCLVAAFAPCVLTRAARAQEIDPTLAPMDESAPLPQDPRLVTRTLDNGLRVLALSHPTPPGRVLVWARVGVGSLDEGEDQLAFARLSQEVSLAGVRGGEWQAALDRLARRGLNPDEAFGGRTRPDQTVFWLALPDADPDALDAGLALLGRVVFDATLDAGELERARDLTLEALRARDGAEARARTQWMPELGGGFLIGRRPAQGDEASVRAAGAGGVLAFRSAWYTPGNTTVMVVGDVDTGAVTRAVARWFEPLAPRPTPARQVRCSSYPDARRVAIGSDPELSASEIAFVSIAPPSGPVRTQGDLRRFLLEQTTMRALDARVSAAIAEGRLSAIGQGVYGADLYGAVHVAQIAVTAPAGGWRRALAELAVETQRVREHGFTRAETDEAIARMLTRLEEYTELERSLPAGELMRWLGYNDAAGHVWMSMGAELELARRILIGVRADELTRVLREMMPEGTETVIVTSPDAGIGDDEVLSIVEEAMDDPGGLPETPAPPSVLVKRLPAAGPVVEISAHPASGVWSAWLANNVRVHHRRVPGVERRVVVRATLGGGALGRADGLLAEACAQAWDRPAVEGATSVQIRRLLSDARVKVKAWGDGDGLTLELDASPEDLVLAFELAHRLLLDPSLDAPALERWRRERLVELDKSRHDPVARLDEVIDEALARPAGAGAGVVGSGRSGEDVRGVTLDAARRWLAGLVASAPLEVAVVGDVSRTEAFELCERYLGSLAVRERVGRGLGPGDQNEPRAMVRETRIEGISSRTPVAGVAVGFVAGCDSESGEGLRLAVAARVLQARLNATLRERLRVAPTVRCTLREGAGGDGALLVRTTCDPARGEEVARLIERAIDVLGRGTMDLDEVAAAASQLHGEYRDALATPGFWAHRLSTLERRGRSLDDIVTALDRHASVTPGDVRAAVAERRASARGLTLITRPSE